MLYSAIVYSLLVAFTVAQDCHDYVLISTRGTYEIQGSSIGFYGMINTTLQTIPNGIEYDTVYPAAPNTTSAPVGVVDVVRYITSGLSACPRQVYALLGYSQGASVTNAALANFTEGSAAYDAIKAVLVIGNPGHNAGASANVDENGGDSNRNVNGSSIARGRPGMPQSYYDDDKVLDICYQGDTICALPPNVTAAIEPAHLLYGTTQSVQDMGAEFLIEKLGGSFANPTASASMSATPTTNASSTRATSTAAATYTGDATAPSAINAGLFLGLAAALVVV